MYTLAMSIRGRVSSVRYLSKGSNAGRTRAASMDGEGGTKRGDAKERKRFIHSFSFALGRNWRSNGLVTTFSATAAHPWAGSQYCTVQNCTVTHLVTSWIQVELDRSSDLKSKAQEGMLRVVVVVSSCSCCFSAPQPESIPNRRNQYAGPFLLSLFSSLSVRFVLFCLQT